MSNNPKREAVARKKLELWFFRDLVDDQRMKLLALFGWPQPEVKTMHEQKVLFHLALGEIKADAILALGSADVEARPVAWLYAGQSPTGDFVERITKVPLTPAGREGLIETPLYAPTPKPAEPAVEALNEDLIAVPREVLAAANYIIQGSVHAGSNTAARMREYALAFPIINGGQSCSKTRPQNTTDAVEALRDALEPFVAGYSHTKVFLASREKMHPAGLDLYREDVERARLALAALTPADAGSGGEG